MENFIKFAPCTPFQGTLPRELVEKVGCPAWEVGAAVQSPAPGPTGLSLLLTDREQRAGGPGGTGSEGSGPGGRPHVDIPFKSIENTQYWCGPSPAFPMRT